MTTTKELLLDYKKELMELKTEHEESLKEIDKEITECEMALKAIEPVSELATEDLSNLHSFQHASPEPKKPYRIKTRQEMIDGGATAYDDGYIYPTSNDISWSPAMNYLHGRELDTNKMQKIKAEPNQPIDEWTIAPWMITENN